MLKGLDNTKQNNTWILHKKTLTVIINYIDIKQKTLLKKGNNQNTTSKSLQKKRILKKKKTIHEKGHCLKRQFSRRNH